MGLLLGPAALFVGLCGVGYDERGRPNPGSGLAYAGIVIGLLTSLANWGVILYRVVCGPIRGLFPVGF